MPSGGPSRARAGPAEPAACRAPWIAGKEIGAERFYPRRPSDPGGHPLTAVREEPVAFQGITATLHGRILAPTGEATGALVLAHGRNGSMDEPLIDALARFGAELGLWTFRFNFAFRETGAEPSAGHEDEIADLREAVAQARQLSGLDRVTVAGRGLGAWATVACVTDEDAENAILLGLAYTGQPERRMALARLDEFEIPTLIVVGSASDRVDLPALRDIVDPMPLVRLEIVEDADHRLQDASGRPMVEAVLRKVATFLLPMTQ